MVGIASVWQFGGGGSLPSDEENEFFPMGVDFCGPLPEGKTISDDASRQNSTRPEISYWLILRDMVLDAVWRQARKANFFLGECTLLVLDLNKNDA